jgi:hypothetical protein
MLKPVNKKIQLENIYQSAKFELTKSLSCSNEAST